MPISEAVINTYEATIGIECHVQLKTKTKLFAAVDNDARSAEQNTLISPLCFGLPGALPVLNHEAVELAIRAGIALNAEVAEFSKFDRKHYFYPDLPLGYQITQLDEPTIGKGCVEVPLDGDYFKVHITRAHMEADAGKSTHPDGAQYSLVDLNRAGTPLLEIVTEPDMHTAKEAKAFAKELYFLMKYSGASYVNLFHGNMRFDVNVSVAKKGSTELGTRTETKNLNSFRSIEKAIDYEIIRQIELLEKGEKVHQQTRGWDDSKSKTFVQRDKEDAHDYRYFPDPDLPPIEIETSHVESIRSSMPPLPPEIRKKLLASGVSLPMIDTILENEDWVEILLTATDESTPNAVKKMASWLAVDIPALSEDSSKTITYSHLSELYDMLNGGSLSSTAAKDVLAALLSEGGSVKDIVERNNLAQVSDNSIVEKYVDEVISQNQKAVDDVRSGELKAMGFLVGQVMKLSKGQANPGMVNTILKDKLDL